MPVVTNPNFEYGRWLSSPPPGEEVVISGIAGRLPESHHIHEFRDHLFAKRGMVTSTDRRWVIDHPEIPKRNAKTFHIDKLDAGFFGVHYRQADIADPMVRTFMEVAIECIIDAGINPGDLKGTRTGVFASACWSDMENHTLMNITQPQTMAVTGYLRSFISHRVSYYLKLKGPAFNVDTACSSSSNAMDTAFRALRAGHCDNAIVGAVNILQHPGNTLQFYRLGVLSMDGNCKVFDQDANGYVKGETIACVFLQKAKTSRRIYAQVVNVKVNSDGFKEEGITYPSTLAQKELMMEIYNESGIHPNHLSFMEAHGTGTAVGDPQEVEAIDIAIASKRNKSLLVGSVKSSIGHTEPASGLCSIFKVLIAMETGMITPNINLKQIKKGMTGFEEGRMKVVTELTELEKDDAIVGINNFGFGGNNVHMILRRFPKIKRDGGVPEDDIPRLVCVSGRTENAVLSLLNYIKEQKLDSELIGLLHHTYKSNIDTHVYRGYALISNQGTIKMSTSIAIGDKSPLYLYFGTLHNNYQKLGRRLSKFPIFKHTISQIDKLLVRNNIDTYQTILNCSKDSHLDILGAVFTQLGFVDIIKQLQLEPTAVYFDEWGKLISEYFYEVIDLQEAVETSFRLANFDVESKIEMLIDNEVPEGKVPNACFRLKIESLLNNSKLQSDLSLLNTLPQNALLLNISDSNLNQRDVLVPECNTIKFLDILGRLYEQGHNFLLHKLYPEVNYPVSRGTPMISPSLKWDHSKSWYTYKFSEFFTSDAEQKEYNISFLDPDFKFVAGHVIDGRNLFPATEYLNLVWQTFAQSRRLLKQDIRVVFEDCHFVRAVTMPASGYVRLLVTVQRGTGNFELCEKGSIVVYGRIRLCDNISEQFTNLQPHSMDYSDPTQVMEHDEIYRELYLRGYNYSGVFKGIAKCDVMATTALIKWENNWSSFMDKMLQLKILQTDTRMLYVPTEIKKLVIDPTKRLGSNTDEKDKELLYPVYVYNECNIIKSEGIEICGLQARSIAKRKPRLEPVLEINKFIPNQSVLSLTEAIRVNIQLILENSLENQFNAVEIIDESTNPDSEILLPLVCNALEDVPLVTPKLILSTKETVEEVPGVSVENYVLTPESKLLLIIGSKIIQNQSFPNIVKSLKPNGFVLTREECPFTDQDLDGIEPLTEFRTGNETLILFKEKSKNPPKKAIKITSPNFGWLPQLQRALRDEPSVLVYAQNAETEGILGLVNCLRREPSGHKVQCFFIVDQAPLFDQNADFYAEQIQKNLAVNIYKNGKWGTYRHLLLEDPEDVECEHCFGNVTMRGDLSTLKWIEGPLTAKTTLGEKEMLISIYYSAINFRDIMAASGRVNVDTFTTDRIEQECVMGFEFSGKDPNGRLVMGIVPNKSLSNYVIADSKVAWEVPEAWSLEDAATIPVVYATVLHALFYVAKMKRGSSILIHSGTGGIGFAALNVCIYHDCDIYVTVGTQEKRDYLRKHYPQIPESHIGNSRDTSFETMIKNETKGRGVDMVLNSLSEDKLKASVRCLSRGGHFLEIGKFDLGLNTDLELLAMNRKISFHGIMLDRIIEGTSELKTQLGWYVREGIAAGYVKPIPRTVFPMEEMQQAHRYLMTGKHMGKVLVKIRDEEESRNALPEKKLQKAFPRFNCDPEKSYVILGGLGGVGLELADWLVLRGATKLVLVSRNGIQTGYQQQRIRLWRSYGVHVKISTKDVTTKAGCSDLIKESAEVAPIDAIFNLAVVLKDALFEEQTEESFWVSFHPKARATMFLDELTREMCPELKHFVVFSSVSCGRGNAGQTNYGMANSIMERICEKRKQDGFPALAIQWGAIGEVGLVAKMQKVNKELVIGGTLQQRISSCLEVLNRLLKQDNPVVSSMVVAEKHNKNLGLHSAVDAVALVLGIKDIKTVSQHATLPELGMDSMMGTELIQLLEKDFDIFLTPKDIRNMTLAKLVEAENEKKSSSAEGSSRKANLGASFLIQHMPCAGKIQSTIVEIPSQENNKKTIFLLPGIEGVFPPLEPLAKNLKARVLGLQYNALNQEETIQEIARNMMPHIETNLDGRKDFTIIGYSFGSAVSLELALLLEDKGYTGKVIVIEGSPTYLTSSINKLVPCETESEFQTFVIFKVLEILLPMDIIIQFKDKLLQCATMDERLDLSVSLVTAEIKTKHDWETPGVVALYKRAKALKEYHFGDKKVKSTIHLFKARIPLIEEEDDYQLSKICEQKPTVTAVDGDHVSLLNHESFAQMVNEHLT